MLRNTADVFGISMMNDYHIATIVVERTQFIPNGPVYTIYSWCDQIKGVTNFTTNTQLDVYISYWINKNSGAQTANRSSYPAEVQINQFQH